MNRSKVAAIIRREYLDHVFYWNANDLQRKLDEFRSYFNEVRVHAGIEGRTPARQAELTEVTPSLLTSELTGQPAGVVIPMAHSGLVHRRYPTSATWQPTKMTAVIATSAASCVRSGSPLRCDLLP